jgi:hypothetical protein
MNGRYLESNLVNCLTCAERDDAADWIVGRHANRDAITGDDFDSEAAHAAAQLRQHFVAGVALHAVKTAGMNRDDGALHINQIIFAQKARPFALAQQ